MSLRAATWVTGPWSPVATHNFTARNQSVSAASYHDGSISTGTQGSSRIEINDCTIIILYRMQ
jgi:hypothetical protein